MYRQVKSILFTLDFLGIIPQLKILNYNIYKSLFSSILSLLIIIFSVAFGIYSFIQFINQKPMIDYYKNNDFNTNKAIAISDSFIMFKIVSVDYDDITIKNISLESFYFSIETNEFINLKVETCEYRKNINLKHQELFKNFEKREGESIGDYFCINFIGKNISLFHHPNYNNLTGNYIRLIISSNKFKYKIKFFSIKIITENDIISHNDKENPIIPYYYYYDTVYFYNISEILSIKYDFQYIKYESDTGILFENLNNANAIGFSGLSYSNSYNVQNSSIIAVINFGVNKSNFDYYKRTYRKFQSFLADLMSIIHLIISIFKLLTYFLLNKKMNKDIIRKIMMVNEFKEFKGKFSHYNKNGLVKSLKDNDKNKDKSISVFDDKQNSKEVIKESYSIQLKDVILNERNIKILKNITLFNIIKSFFCFKDVKSKLIDLCNKIINEDICIDRILSRLYNLEKVYSLIENEEFHKCALNRNEEFQKINNYLFQISYEIEGNINNKSEKNKKENIQIK